MAEPPKMISGHGPDSYMRQDYLREYFLPWMSSAGGMGKGMPPPYDAVYPKDATDDEKVGYKAVLDDLMYRLMKNARGFDLYGKFPGTDPANQPTPAPTPGPTPIPLAGQPAWPPRQGDPLLSEAEQIARGQ